jgi:hypothetical protein
MFRTPARSASIPLPRLRFARLRRRRRAFRFRQPRLLVRARPTARVPAVRIWREPLLWASLVALGAAMMYVFDPRLGRRRRALLRDKAVKAYHFVTRRAPERIEHRARYVAGRLHGLEHEVAHEVGHLLHPDAETPPDNVTLAQRVRSEIFAPADIPDGAINVDAYEGIVTLRGELPTQEMIERVVRMAKRVEGVREVRNLMHTPGMPVPPH